MENLIEKLQKANNFFSKDVYEVIGGEAEKFYKKSFRDEGFTDKSLEKWKDVKRRTNPRPSQRKKASSSGSRKFVSPEGVETSGQAILTNSGYLGESIKYEVTPPYIVIHASGKGDDGGKIAQVHNEGGKAGRKSKQFDMPQRQFIGKSATLKNLITEEIKSRLNNL